MTDASVGVSVAIVPARGGSKRIPRKNIRPFLGTPLLVRTLEVLQVAGVFDRVVVSTEDGEVAALALEAGADVPFRRSEELSDDHTGIRPVIQHAIRQLESRYAERIELVCSVYATAVFVKPADLVASRAMLLESPASFVLSATSFAAPIQRALRRLPDGSCEMIQPEHRLSRSQDLEEAYHDAGQFCWGTRDAWLTDASVFGPESRLFVLPRWRVQDIDTDEDWRRAELMARALGEADG